jgi:hypothetical protein
MLRGPFGTYRVHFWRQPKRTLYVPNVPYERPLPVAAYERGEIGDTDLAHYLRCDIVRAREIASLTLSSREIDSLGEQSAWRLDFAKSLLSATP